MTGSTEIRETPIEFREIQELVGRDDPVIFEIGSCGGWHTNKFLESFPAGRVYAFEPDPRAIRRWRQKVRSSRATLAEIALGAQNGIAQFHASDGCPPGREDVRRFVEEGWDCSGSLREPKSHLTVHPWVKFERILEVQVRTLDSWVAENDVRPADFIWADVQGAEGDLISGGLETLKGVRYFYTEYSNGELYSGQVTLDQIAEMLSGWFELETRWQHDVLFKNKHV